MIAVKQGLCTSNNYVVLCLTKIHHYRGREEERGRLGKAFRNSR